MAVSGRRRRVPRCSRRVRRMNRKVRPVRRNHHDPGHSVILIDPEEQSRAVLIEACACRAIRPRDSRARSRGQCSPLQPPCAVVADLWMASISGVQLTRLLRAEPLPSTCL